MKGEQMSEEKSSRVKYKRKFLKELGMPHFKREDVAKVMDMTTEQLMENTDRSIEYLCIAEIFMRRDEDFDHYAPHEIHNYVKEARSRILTLKIEYLSLAFKRMIDARLYAQNDFEKLKMRLISLEERVGKMEEKK
jgi:hypothetical protein